MHFHSTLGISWEWSVNGHYPDYRPLERRFQCSITHDIDAAVEKGRILKQYSLPPTRQLAILDTSESSYVQLSNIQLQLQPIGPPSRNVMMYIAYRASTSLTSCKSVFLSNGLPSECSFFGKKQCKRYGSQKRLNYILDIIRIRPDAYGQRPNSWVQWHILRDLEHYRLLLNDTTPRNWCVHGGGRDGISQLRIWSSSLWHRGEWEYALPYFLSWVSCSSRPRYKLWRHCPDQWHRVYVGGQTLH